MSVTLRAKLHCRDPSTEIIQVLQKEANSFSNRESTKLYQEWGKAIITYLKMVLVHYGGAFNSCFLVGVGN